MVSADRSSVQSFTTNDGLPNNVVYKIQGSKIEGETYLWFSTDNGLCRLVNRPDGSFGFVPYGQSDGLSCTTFNPGAGTLANGTMIFGCNKGMIRFHPNALIANQQAPRVQLTDFQMFFEPVPFRDAPNSPLDRPIWETKSLDLRHDQNVPLL